MPVVTMPDGSLVDMPEELTQEQGARLRAMQTGVQKPKEKNIIEKYVNEPIAGIGEAALSLGTGLGASVVGGLQGLATIASGKGVYEAADAVRKMQEQYTYQPSTEPGKSLIHIAGIPFEVAGSVLGKGGGAVVGNALGISGGAEIGQSIGEALPGAIGTLYGGSSALRSAGGATVMPSRVPLLSDIKDVVQKAGHRRIAEQAMQKAVPTEELQQTISALESRSTPVVPGSPVTSADAIARANRAAALKGQPQRFGGQLVAMQDDLSKVPETSGMLNTIKLQQEQARAAAIAKGAGTQQQYEAAIAKRAEVTEPLYAQIENSKAVVDVSPTVSYLDTLISKRAGDKTLVTALNDVKTSLIDAEGNARTSPGVLQSSIDNINSLLTKQENAAIRKPLMGAKESLVAQINKVEAAQGIASSKFAELSKPINQMDLWKALQQKFISPTGKEAPGAYIRALQDEVALIKKATGFKRGTGLEDIFNKEQSALAARLAAEMEMELVKRRMGTEINVPGSTRLAEGFEPSLPNILSRTAMVTNFILKHLAKNANKDVNIIAAQILADPKMLASVLKQVKPNTRKHMLVAIKDIAINKGVIATGAAVNKPQQEVPQQNIQNIAETQPNGIEQIGPLLTEQAMRDSFGNPGSIEEDEAQNAAYWTKQ